MAELNLQTVNMPHPVVLGNCDFRPEGSDAVRFVCPGMAARGTVNLHGTGNESVTGWKLGFIQLQFVETNYASYRGRTVSEGSAKVTRSHSRLCRDSVNPVQSNLWYAPQEFNSPLNQGTFQPPTLPASGNLRMISGITDAPGQRISIKIRNRNHDNFLHHVDIGFHFCTMMAAENPQHRFTILKHFYWNVHWEAHFAPNAAGVPQLIRRDNFAMRVQRQVHSGIPNDSRFRNKVLSHSLPFSNEVANRMRPHTELSNDWSLA